ncbi:phosphoglucosamine mutase [Anaerospora sp.]|jgi:phosphoglucosamine mutase|uniref:phosphoglucosamine mutase n=1 Tax=Anaerospora sp. TaxID=1960278 RepID=UPI002899F976|nr:phosphoglucosamine mutase [Anaerospora sp.]
MTRLFGTDGVRGVANTELTAELAYKMGRAATFLFGEEHANPVVIIGRDTRISGQMLEAALAAGICSAGGQAILMGVVPTPAVAYLTRKLDAQAGVVISASHNPYPDNGIKFFAGTGYKLPDAVEDRLEELVQAQIDTLPRPIGSSVGTITHRHDLIQDYMDFIAGTVPVDFSGLKVVVDCSHGAAYEVAPLLLKRLGADVIVMNNQPTGININDHCGSTHLEGLQKAVLEHHADIGIAHDGDADRCLAIDEEGQVIDGDQIMVMCTLNLMKEGKLKDNTLVATVMSNIGLHKAIKQAGGKVLVTPVGDRYVLETMVEKGLVLGGEQSGHIIFGDYNTTGDGVLTALQLITAVKSSGKKLSELGKLMTKFPQLLVNVRVKSQIGWQENAAISAAVAAGEAELGDSGRILVRSSGTEPLIRVMAEGPCQTELKRIVNNIADVVKSELV